MIVHLWLLLTSLLVLWFPRQWLRMGGDVIPASRARRSKRPTTAARDTPLHALKQLLKLRNVVDFARALIGGLAVVYLCFDEAPDAGKFVGAQIFLIQAAVFLVAVLIQTIRVGHDGLTLVAPVFFFFGLSFGLIGWKAALFACVPGLLLTRMLPGPGISLFVFAALEAGFGVLLRGASFRMILMSVILTIIPVVLSGVLKRPIAWLHKSQTKPM